MLFLTFNGTIITDFQIINDQITLSLIFLIALYKTNAIFRLDKSKLRRIMLFSTILSFLHIIIYWLTKRKRRHSDSMTKLYSNSRYYRKKLQLLSRFSEVFYIFVWLESPKYKNMQMRIQDTNIMCIPFCG